MTMMTTMTMIQRTATVLSINDYNHLKLLYDKFYKSNRYINILIENDDWESVDIAIQEKEALLRQIIFFEKPRLDAIKSNKELLKIRKKLVDLEKQNIALVVSLREKTKEKFSQIKKAKKILNTYEPASNKAISTFDIKEDN